MYDNKLLLTTINLQRRINHKRSMFSPSLCKLKNYEKNRKTYGNSHSLSPTRAKLLYLWDTKRNPWHSSEASCWDLFK